MRSIKGELNLPGDKSISHRSALFAAMHTGQSEFTNFNFNADCTATLCCLIKLGVQCGSEEELRIICVLYPGRWPAPASTLDAMNSGTTARLLSGLLSGLSKKNRLTGDDSLRRRPMKRIIEPLAMMGAHIESKAQRLPLTFFPVPVLRAITYELPVASAQVKSAVLLAGLLADGQTIVREPVQTRDHTERLLKLKTRTDPDSGIREISSSRQ
jgi:3-phosphoshikimate 1-carboxyvinyltransferase